MYLHHTRGITDSISCFIYYNLKLVNSDSDGARVSCVRILPCLLQYRATRVTSDEYEIKVLDTVVVPQASIICLRELTALTTLLSCLLCCARSEWLLNVALGIGSAEHEATELLPSGAVTRKVSLNSNTVQSVSTSTM
jgi:hypothetical protein